MLRINKPIGFIIVISLFAISCKLIGALSTRGVSHRSLETNKEFEAIWNILDIEMLGSNQRANMVGAPGRIIIEGWRRYAIPTATLIGIHSVSGNNVWTISYGSNGDSIIAQGEILYRGTVGTAMVESYSTESGKFLWLTLLPWAHSTSDIYFAGNNIFVHTSDGEFFILNDAGKIIDTFSESSRTFLEIDGVLYMEKNFSIIAIESPSKKELWRLEIHDRFTHAPIFYDGAIFLRTLYDPTEIYSIDQKTGKINWKISQDVISNLYVSGEKIYYLNRDAYLVTINRESGDEISRIMFSPLFDLDKPNDGYFVCGDPSNNVLAVSFGDNDQIMGLKIINP